MEEQEGKRGREFLKKKSALSSDFLSLLNCFLCVVVEKSGCLVPLNRHNYFIASCAASMAWCSFYTTLIKVAA